MSSRATAAADLRSRIAGNLAASASGEGPEPPRSVIAGVNALPTPTTPESGVMTSEPPKPADIPAVGTERAGGAAPAAATPEPATAAAPATPLPAPAAAVPLPEVPTVPAPAPAASAKGWDKLSITLSRSDFGILEVQTGQARAAGIKMRRGGNPSVFLRAALRNLEALRLTNPAAWVELVRGAASSENS